METGNRTATEKFQNIKHKSRCELLYSCQLEEVFLAGFHIF